MAQCRSRGCDRMDIVCVYIIMFLDTLCLLYYFKCGLHMYTYLSYNYVLVFVVCAMKPPKADMCCQPYT